VILLADIGRVLILAVLVAILVLSVVTLRRYGTKERNQGNERRRSRHVRRVALSHIGALVILSVETTARFGKTGTLRLPFALLFASLSLSALVDLLLYQRTQKAEAPHD